VADVDIIVSDPDVTHTIFLFAGAEKAVPPQQFGPTGSVGFGHAGRSFYLVGSSMDL